MKKKPTPQPTRISSYFFQQLIDSGTLAPEDRGKNAQSEQTRRMVAVALSDSYTPEAVTALLQKRVAMERQHSEALEEALEECWRRVEDIIERNKERRRVIEEDIPQAVAPVNRLSFWTCDGVERFYNLKTLPIFSSDRDNAEPGSGLYSDTNANSGEHDIKGSATVGAAATSGRHCGAENTVGTGEAVEWGEAADEMTRPSSQGARCKPLSVPGTHHAHAWRMTEKELLDESKVPHCLRRLFASLLRRRGEFPKSTTLLFDSIQRLQSEKFPQIETVMEDVPFSMPLHRPFRCIASFLSQSFGEVPRGEGPEKAFTEFFKVEDKNMKTAYERLHGLKDGALATSDRTGRAEVIYQTLLGELSCRKSLHEAYARDIRAVTELSNGELNGMEGALKECDKMSRRLLSNIEDNCTAFIDDVRTSLARRMEAIEEIDSFYQRDRGRLHLSLQRKIYRAKKSEELQEKGARRIREVTKELYLEQIKYEELLQEIVAESLLLQQLDNSYAQLSGWLNNATSVHHESKVRSICESLQQSEEVRAYLIEQCQYHINRLRKDEHYRRCRLATHAKDNALSWSRCLNDLSAIYETHFDCLNEKCKVSTQMRYLLSYEKDCISRDLNQVQKEMEHLDNKWQEVSDLLEELGEPVPPLSLLEKNSSCEDLRRALTAVTLTHLVHGESSHLVRPEKWRANLVVADDGSGAPADAAL